VIQSGWLAVATPGDDIAGAHGSDVVDEHVDLRFGAP